MPPNFPFHFFYMNHYYQTYYQNHCHPEQFTWFDTYHYPLIVSHTLAIIATPLQVFGGYCILYKTPANMRNLKWTLFLLHFWTSLYDLGVNVFLTFMPFVPQNSQLSVGVLAQLGVPPLALSYLSNCLMQMVSTAYIIIFENRHNLIVMDKFKIPNALCRWAFYFFNYTISPFLLILSILLTNRPNQDDAKLKKLELHPCPSPDFFHPRHQIFFDDYYYPQLFSLIRLLIFITQFLFFTIHTAYYLIRKNHVMSENTRKLQMKIFKAICLQFLIPMLFLGVPNVYMGASIIFRYYNQALMNSVLILFFIHGIVATFILIFLHDPYRKFAMSYFLKEVSRALLPARSVTV